MKNNLLILLVLIITTSFSWAQRPKGEQYTIMLNGNNIIPQESFQEMKENLIKSDFGKDTDKLGWFIIQFNCIPTIQEQKKLEEQGVFLQNYIQGNAYFTSVSSKILFVEDSKIQKNIRSLTHIKPEYKINRDLVEGNIPDYAKGKGDYIKVVITFFKNVDEQTLSKGISNIEMNDVRILKSFNQIYAEVLHSDLITIASQEWIQNIELVSPPAELDNNNGVNLHRTNILKSDLRGLGYGLTGKGVKIGLWDADVDKHRDFSDRVINREREMYDTDHGTHTCGTITGAGIIDPKAQGMATEAQLYTWNYNTQSNGKTVPEERLISLENDGIEITSNSWGHTVKTCPNPYSYNSTDQAEDMIACEYPYFLYVFSAGNTQTVCPDGFYTSSKNLKNSLIVAAIDKMDEISYFSSFGPTNDGRLIPNISADGVRVYSTYLDNGYGIISGTSMATPGVAGTMALIYQRFKETHADHKPGSALLRALACNTAKDFGAPGPDYKYGYGEINGLRAIEVMEQNHYFIDSVSQGTSYSKDIKIPSGATALRVMLAWTDPAGVVGASKILINNLDLSVTNNGTETLPWVLDPLNPSLDAVRGYDELNNMEQVTIQNPLEGTYTININGYEIPEGKQEFAVVYDIVMPTLKLTYPIGEEYFTPGDEEVIHWDCEGYTQPFTIEYSNDGGVNYSIIALNIDPNLRSYLWTVPSDITNNAKIRISSGSVLDELKSSFNVMYIPQNVKIGQAKCGGEGPFTMQWDAINNAKYEVLKLNGQVYELLAEVTDNKFDIKDIQSSNDNWFCVRAIDLTTGAISQRSLAVTVNPAVAVSSLPFSEDFENQKADNFYFDAVKGQGSVRYANDIQKYGIRMEGSTISTDWVDPASAELCFTQNPDYVVTTGICSIDATSLSGSSLMLKFDYRQKYRTTPNSSYFRVKVNGDYLPNSDGTIIYGGVNQVSYKTVYYNLNSYAGNPSVNIEFEAVCKTNHETYVNSSNDYVFSDLYDKGDFVGIDNVEIFNPRDDLSLTSLTLGTGNTSTEAITIKVKNLSGSEVINVPVSYTCGEDSVSEIIDGPIASMGEVTYIFEQKVDFSAVGETYHVTASVNWTTDPVITNNFITKSYSNAGNDIIMGIATGTVATCSGSLTDPSGRYDDYSTAIQKLLTIKPDITGKKTKITFTEFETGPDDKLMIWAGPQISGYPLIATLSGNAIPASITSSAAGGELTFLWTAKGTATAKGFVADIECVDGAVKEASILAIAKPLPSAIRTAPEDVAITVKNLGSQDLSDVEVYYQINTLPVQTENIPSLTAGQTLYYTFTTKADFTAEGQYTLKAGINVPDDEDESNNRLTKIITTITAKSDVGIFAIPVFKPAREALTTISATVKNYGNQTVTDIEVAYSINGTEVVQTVPGTLLPGANKFVKFTTMADLREADKEYNIEVYTKLADDADASNDKKTAVIVTPPAYTGTNTVGSFNGTNALVEAAFIPSTNLQTNFTVECWVKPSAVVKYGRIFDKTSITLFYQSDYSTLYAENSLILSVTTAAGNFKYCYPGIMNLDQWQHIALTVNSTNDYILYHNGIVQTPLLIEGGVVGTASSNAYNPLTIGNIADLTRGVKGCIDEFRIWNSVLSQSTISDNMMTDYPANTAGMVAYYKFKEGSGNYIYDYSTNDNTAIISGTDVSGIGDNMFWNEPGNLLADVNFTGEATPTTFDAETKTFISILPIGTDLTDLAANFSSLQNSIVKINDNVQTSGVTINDFTDAVNYTVEGIGFNSGINQTYTVKVLHDKSSECDLITYSFETGENAGLSEQINMVQNGNNFNKKLTPGIDLTALKASFTASSEAKVYIDGIEHTSPMVKAIDYSNPVMVTVESENGRYIKNYSIFLDARNNAAELSSFNIVDNQVGPSNIDKESNQVDIWVKGNTDLSMLTSTFSVSQNATLYARSIFQRDSITANNFTDPIVYTVVSEDESISVDWIVKVQKDIIKPEITLLGDGIIEIPYGSAWSDPGAIAYDNAEGDISSSIIVSGSVNTNLVGTYEIEYNVSDISKNTATEVTRTVNVVKAVATINITNTTQIYDGTPKTVIVTTVPENLAVNITYNESSIAPVNADTYNIAVTVNDVNYQGSQNSILVIEKAAASIYVSDTSHQYDGTPKAATITTVPESLAVDVTYNGSSTVPANANTYNIVVTVNDANYQGSQNSTLVIEKATASISISDTSQIYDGTPKAVTITTVPENLSIDVSYNGSAVVPSNVGVYNVVAVINEANFKGTQTATLQINTSTGIESDDLNSVNIYSDNKNIFVVVPFTSGSVQLNMYNMIGNMIFNSENLTQGLNKVEHDFVSGIYIVKVIVDNKVYTKKVMLTK